MKRLSVVFAAALVVAGLSLVQPTAAEADECRAACQVARATCLHAAAKAKAVCREVCEGDALNDQSPRSCRKACVRAFSEARKSCHKAVAGCVGECTDGNVDRVCLGECRQDLAECGAVFRECAGDCRIDGGVEPNDRPAVPDRAGDRPAPPDGGRPSDR